MSNKIKFLVTGGTIDDLNYDDEEHAPKNHKSLIPNLLKQLRIDDYKIELLMQKDSRLISDKDRELILDRCKNSKEIKIIISHGTFTLSDTAKYLGKANLDKTIVLFGAMIPANKENSDALNNLGQAIEAVKKLDYGVFIVMNGKIFNWDNVRKNLSTGMFEELNRFRHRSRRADALAPELISLK
jgi:L-asparaginase